MKEGIELLLDEIEEAGTTIPKLAAKAGIDKYVLYKRIKGQGEWKASEITGLAKALKMTNKKRDRIFL